MQTDNPPLSPTPNMRPQQLAAWLGLGLSKTYELMKAGEVETFHIGRATLITGESATAFRDRMIEAERAARDAA